MDRIVHIEVFAAVVIGLAVVAMASYAVMICLIVGESRRKGAIISKLKVALSELKQRQQKLEQDLEKYRYQTISAEKLKNQQLAVKAVAGQGDLRTESMVSQTKDTVPQRKDATQQTDMAETPQQTKTKATLQQMVDRELEQIMEDIVCSQQNNDGSEDYAECGDDYVECGGGYVINDRIAPPWQGANDDVYDYADCDNGVCSPNTIPVESSAGWSYPVVGDVKLTAEISTTDNVAYESVKNHPHGSF